ncbi:hypothetical protein AUP68_05701 [Ilyonectria robusta]
MPPTKSAKATHETEVSLKDLFKVQIILHPVAPLEGLWQGEWDQDNQSITSRRVTVDQVTQFDDAFEPFPWLERINGLVLAKEACHANMWSPNSGSCLSKLIRRDSIQHEFYSRIQEPTVDTAMMGLELFDQHGRLIPDFSKGGSREGSGIWNREVDTGDILLIDEFHIKDNHNGFVLGNILFDAIIGKTRSRSRKFLVIATPTAFARERASGSLE